MSDFLKPDWNRLNERFGTNPHPVFAFYGPGGGVISVDAVRRARTQRDLWRGSTNKSEHFETWESVFALRGNAEFFGLGPCILLREIDRTVCIDLDPYEAPKGKPHNDADEKAHTLRINEIAAWAQKSGWLVERSRSGHGWHIFVRGEWPNRMDNLPDGLGEIFGSKQHINLTGHFLPFIVIDTGETQLERGAKFLAQVKQYFFNGFVERKKDLLESLDLVETEAYGRRLDLTDEQVIEALEYAGTETSNYTPHERFSEVYRMFFFGETTASDHSEDMFKLASAFDKITGDHNQVLRLLAQSALYLRFPHDSKGEDRIHKFERNARKGFYRIREGNNKALDNEGTLFTWRPYQIWHLTKAINVPKQIAIILGVNALNRHPPVGPPPCLGELTGTGSLAAKMRLQTIRDGKVRTYAIQDQRRREVVEDTGGLSMNNYVLSEVKKCVPELICAYTLPPGAAGRLIMELSEGLTSPYEPFYVNSGLMMLSSLIGRCVCDPNGSETSSLFAITAAPPHKGKTESVTVADRFVKNALTGIYSDPNDLTKNVIHGVTRTYERVSRSDWRAPNSPEGLYDIIRENNGGVLMNIDDAESFMRKLIDERNTMGVAIKRDIKQLYDVCKPGSSLAPNSSRATKKANSADAIQNPAVNMHILMTNDVLASIDFHEIADGTFSRPVIIYDRTPVNDILRFPADCRKSFSFEMMQFVQTLVAEAEALDFEYMRYMPSWDKDGNKLKPDLHLRDLPMLARTIPTFTLSPEAERMNQSIAHTMNRITRVAQDENNPLLDKEYQIFTRMARNILRRAAVVAYINQRYAVGPTLSLLKPGEASREWKGANFNVVVGVEELTWAAGFIIKAGIDLMVGYAMGEISVTADKSEQVIAKYVMNYLKRAPEEHNGIKWCKKNDVRGASRVKPFVGGQPNGTELFRKILAIMIENRSIIAAEKDIRGQMTELIRPNLSDPLWRGL